MTAQSTQPEGLPVVAVVTAPREPLPRGLEGLEGRARLRHATTEAELSSALRGAEVLLVTDFRTDVVERAWPSAERLRWVHAMSAGVDMLLFPALVESDVLLTNARGVFDRAIAEFVLGVVLLFAKDLHGTLALQRTHRWRHRDTERVEGARLLVVGAGSIGRAIAKLARAVGLRVTGVARRERASDPDFEQVLGAAALLEALPDADYVVIAAPLTTETRGLFGKEAFRRMRSSARLLNVGRGPIVQTHALVEALRAGELAGAALDVFEEEPLPPEHPLWSMPEVLISAHMAGDFIGWREALSAQFVENFERWRSGEPLENCIDKRRGYGADRR